MLIKKLERKYRHDIRVGLDWAGMLADRNIGRDSKSRDDSRKGSGGDEDSAHI